MLWCMNSSTTGWVENRLEYGRLSQYAQRSAYRCVPSAAYPLHNNLHNTGSAAAYPPPRTLYIIIYIIQGHDTCTCTLVPSSTTGYYFLYSFSTALYALSREAVSSLRNQNLASKDFSQKQDGRFPAGECALYRRLLMFACAWLNFYRTDWITTYQFYNPQ